MLKGDKNPKVSSDKLVLLALAFVSQQNLHFLSNVLLNIFFAKPLFLLKLKVHLQTLNLLGTT
jgi:hypothetical protein